jgi:hypothetical protein
LAESLNDKPPSKRELSNHLVDSTSYRARLFSRCSRK